MKPLGFTKGGTAVYGAARVEFYLAIKTTNAGNAAFGTSRGAMLAKARKRREERKSAAEGARLAMLVAGLFPADLVPGTVIMIRCSAGTLDKNEGPAAALKSIRDGVADALGVNDGSNVVSWRYAQQKVPRGTYGVRVQIVTRRKEART